MPPFEVNAHRTLLEARRAEASALAYMLIALAALALSVALVAWAIWA